MAILLMIGRIEKESKLLIVSLAAGKGSSPPQINNWLYKTVAKQIKGHKNDIQNKKEQTDWYNNSVQLSCKAAVSIDWS